jgi:pSer/pThr/pTyr-binding forkhead associated (FHA) protein
LEATSTTRYRLRFGDRALPVPLPGTLIIGRGTECDVALADPSVSRKHARLVAHADGRVFVEDLGSVHGITVNGAAAREPRQLTHGDRLGIGSNTLVLLDSTVKRSKTQPTPSEPGVRQAGSSTTREMGPETDTMALVRALEVDDRPRAEAIATRVVTRLFRSGTDVLGVQRLGPSLAKLGESDAFWLDRMLELHATCGARLDDAVLTQLEVLALAGRTCSPDVLARYVQVIGNQTDLPSADQVAYRRLQALTRASKHG